MKILWKHFRPHSRFVNLTKRKNSIHTILGEGCLEKGKLAETDIHDELVSNLLQF